jgi:hypothetical protein
LSLFDLTLLTVPLEAVCGSTITGKFLDELPMTASFTLFTACFMLLVGISALPQLGVSLDLKLSASTTTCTATIL